VTFEGGGHPFGNRNPVMSEQSRETTEQRNEPSSTRSGDPAPTPQAPPSSGTVSPEKRKATRWRELLLGAAGVLLVAGALWFGIPWVRMTLNTVSTDDAYVNGHVTFVAARVRGQVSRVLVDDNNRVRKGDLLVDLDKEPFRIAVAIKKAAVDTATAELQATTARVRGFEAEARSRRWTLQHAMEDVDNQVAVLRARVAGLDKSRAELALAELDFDRAAKLVTSSDIPRSEYDRRQAALLAARADVAAALADVHQIRVSLGLPPQPEGGELSQVPADLDQTFSSVLQAQAELIQSAAQLGVIHSYEEAPNQMLEAFEKSDPQGDIDRTFARLAADAPDVKQAEAKLEVAKRDLDQAELDLRYCDVIAEIDGVITRRNVNPGDNVQVGQSLMAIRSLQEIWVDANFKETQLGELRIGQPVDLYLDMYGGRRAFKGRISGFTEGTGSTLALLPAQNATGNFVKVVQRLPVRIELENYDPDKSPLFIGTSVVPYVYINKPPTGPDAGKFLQASAPESQTGASSENPPGAAK
jgi:membrane fusion protein, multidrug efflux system